MIQPRTAEFIGLKAINTLIDDTSPTSAYFEVSNLPDIIPIGKTAFGIDVPPDLLKTSSELKLELVDVNGNAVYTEALNDPTSNLFSEGFTDPTSTARLVTITVYSDTPYGYADLVIVGEAMFVVDANGNKIPVPDEWKGIYNVKWTKRVLIDPNKANDSRVLFYRTPSVTFSEIQQTYLSQVYSGAVTASISTAVSASYKLSYDASNDNTTIHAEGFTFTKDMLGATVSVPSPNVPTYISNNLNGTLGAFTTYISHLWNETTAEVRDVYTASAVVDGKQQYVSATDVLASLRVSHFDASAFTLSYNTAPTYATSPNFKSFAKIDINDLTTISGDIYRVKLFQKSAGSISDWKLITEKVLENTELLFSASADPSAQYMGIFSGQSSFDLYWRSSSFDFSTGLFVSSSNPTVTFNSITIFDGLNVISTANTNGMIVNFIYPNTNFAFKAGQNLQLSFKVASNASIGTLDVYASGSAFVADVKSIQTTLPGTIENSVISDITSLRRQDYPNILGKLLTSYSDKQDTLLGVTRKANYGTVTVPFQVDQDGSGSILFAMRSGSWTISDVSLVYPQETGFNPDAVSLLVPIVTEQENDSIQFLVRFYDVVGKEIVIPPPPPGTTGNGNSFSISYGGSEGGYDSTQGKIGNFPQGIPATIPFLGPSHYIDGTRNILSGSLWVASNVSRYSNNFGTVGSGIEISANASPTARGVIGYGSLMRSLGYEGWVSASLYNRPGFMIWSGSILPDSGDSYSGVGIELWGSGSGGVHALRFRTDTGILEVTGSINATSGIIGGWEILANELRSYPNQNISLSGSGDGYIIVRDNASINRVYVGLIPNALTGSDGFRDTSTRAGTELLFNGDVSIQGGFSASRWDFWPQGGIPVPLGVLATTNSYASNVPCIEFNANSPSVGAGSASYSPLPISGGITWDTPSIGDEYLLTFVGQRETALQSVSSYIRVHWYQVDNGTASLYQTNDVGNFITGSRPAQQPLSSSYSFSYIARTTGSIYFDLNVNTPSQRQYYWNFSLKKYENFVDISPRGIFIFGNPTNYIKMGAQSTSTMQISDITASNAHINTSSLDNVVVHNSFIVENNIPSGSVVGTRFEVWGNSTFLGSITAESASFGGPVIVGALFSNSNFLYSPETATASYVLTSDALGNASWQPATGGSGSGTPGGADKDVQINSAGGFYGDSNLTYYRSSSLLSLTGSFSYSGSTATANGYVLTSDVSGNATWQAPGGSTTASGSVSGSVQYVSASALGANNRFRWDDPNDTLQVTGSLMLSGSGTVTSNFTVSGNFYTNLSASVGKLSPQNAVFDVLGGVVITGSLEVTRLFMADNSASIGKSTPINAVFDVLGGSIMSGSLEVSGALHADQSASVGKLSPQNAVFDVLGNTILSGALEVSGAFHADQSASIGKLTPQNAVFDVYGDSIISGNLTVTGATIGGTWNIFNYVNFQ